MNEVEVLRSFGIEPEPKPKSLKLNLTKVENKNIYNNNNSNTTNNTTYNNQTYYKGFFGMIIGSIISLIKLILKIPTKVLKLDKLYNIMSKNINKEKILRKRRKNLKRLNNIYKLEDNQIF